MFVSPMIVLLQTPASANLLTELVQYKNAVVDVEYRPSIAFNSDHAIVTATIRVKLKSQYTATTVSVERYHKPSAEQLDAYNTVIRNNFHLIQDVARCHNNCSIFIETMKAAARTTLSKKSKEQKREYLTASTWNLIEERQNARNHGNTAEENRLNRDIARQARKEQRQFRIQCLEDLSDTRKCWQHIKMERKTFTPNFYSMKDIHGNRTPIENRANSLANYLYSKHWSPIEHPPALEN